MNAKYSFWVNVSIVLTLLFMPLANTTQPVFAQDFYSPNPFIIWRDGNTYHADSQSTSTAYTGTLKYVVESAAYELNSLGGGTITFQSGEFDLGSEWFEFYDLTDVIFEGQGMDVTLLRNNSSAATDTEPFDCSNCDRLTIRDMTVLAGGPLRSTSDALDFDAGDYNIVERVKVIGARGRGIVFDGKDITDGYLETAEHNIIRDCIVTGVPSDGIEFLASSFNLVENCQVVDVGGYGIQIVQSSSVADQPNKKSNDNVISGNLVENAGIDGINLNGGDRNHITSNTILNSSDDISSQDGILITTTSSDSCDDNIVEFNTATDNQEVKTQRYGLNIATPNCNRTVVIDNDFSGNLIGDIQDYGTNTLYLSNDNEPPTTPTGFTVTNIVWNQVDLAWNESTDNVGITGYTIYRDGVELTTVTSSTLSYSDLTVLPASTYEYRIDAFDGAGNHSALSDPVLATTMELPSSATFYPEADTYVKADSPTSTYGSSTSLRADGEPIVHSYLRFNVQGLGVAVVERARLYIYANSSLSHDLSVHAVNDNSWDEYTTNYNSAPILGNILFTVPSVIAGTWVEFDVTSYVTGENQFSFGVSTSGSTAISLSSRESGLDAPQLIIDFQNIGPDTEPPSVPGNLGANAQGATQVDLSWDTSTDNVGVTGYTIYRDGVVIGTTANLTYSDTSVSSSTTYQYSVDAFDAAGNHSAASSPVGVTTADTQAPTIPTGLSANAISSTQVDLSWNASTDDVAVAGYTIYRDNVEIATTAGLSYSDTGVLSGVTYSYTVDAFDNDGNHSLPSDPVPATTPDIVTPSVPGNLVANAQGATQVDLSWDASTDNVAVTGYTIYRDGVEIGTTASLTYSDTTVSPATTYQYSVDAFDAAGNHSAASTPVPATTANNPPTVPTGLAANVISATQVDLSWNASTDDVSVGGYTIYRDGVEIGTTASLTYNDTTVLSGFTYSYTVDAFDNEGNHSALSEAVQATTPDIEPPSIPGNLVADNSISTQVDLSWDTSTDNVGVTGYTIYRDGVAIGTTANLSYSDTSVSSSTTYQYSVDAFDAAGNYSAASSPVGVTTADTQAPTIPTGLSANAISSTQVDLSWNASTDDVAVAGYTVYRDGVEIATTAGLSYSDNGVLAGVSYNYSVDAFDAAGNHSVASDPVVVVVPDTEPPSVPMNLTADPVSTAQVDLSWDASTDNVGVTGYTIYRDGVELTTVPGAMLTFSDLSVSPATTYQYSVDAFDAAGNHSVESDAVTVTTPDVPLNMTFVAAADTYVSASKPTTNYGTVTSLRIDGSPETFSYLRFDVQDLGGKAISQARLSVMFESKATSGVDLWAVVDNSWDEYTLDYNTAPVMGTLLGASGPVTSTLVLVEFDVTSYITGEGVYSFGISTPGTTQIKLTSREGLNPPQLLIDLE